MPSKGDIMIRKITVQDLKQKLDNKENIVLVDCREKDEYEYCRIQGAVLIPLSEFEERAEKELNPKDAIYIHCHHGGRSMRVCEYLQSLGFESTTNVLGGIEAWSLHVDPKVPRY